MSFKKGDRVRNLQFPEWEIGEVLENSDGKKIRILFPKVGKKTLALSLVKLEKLQDAESSHPILDNLKITATSNGIKHKSFEDSVKRFLSIFSNGFQDEKLYHAEREYKVKAHDLMVETLDEEKLRLLLTTQDFEQICKLALAVVNRTNLVFPNEKISLSEGLKSPENRRLFAESLYSILYGHGEAKKRFETFWAVLEKIGAAKWTIATYFPFITYPEQHMFLKPVVTQEAAEFCAFDLRYKPELNWTTYTRLQVLSDHLIAELKKKGLEPRDKIDLQSFIWCIAQETY
jgi:hypothetical protein